MDALPGDVVFAAGALLMGWDFIVKLRPLYPQAIDQADLPRLYAVRVVISPLRVYGELAEEEASAPPSRVGRGGVCPANSARGRLRLQLVNARREAHTASLALDRFRQPREITAVLAPRIRRCAQTIFIDGRRGKCVSELSASSATRSFDAPVCDALLRRPTSDGMGRPTSLRRKRT